MTMYIAYNDRWSLPWKFGHSLEQHRKKEHQPLGWGSRP
jgi:hypothetical protein